MAFNTTGSRTDRTPSQHDSLCIATYVQAHTLTLTRTLGGKLRQIELAPTETQIPRHCNCMCARCWARCATPQRGDGGKLISFLGRCICPHCPCNNGRLY